MCPDCNGTGNIVVEGGNFGRPYYSKEHKGLVYDWYGKGDWHMAQCPCVGEDE